VVVHADAEDVAQETFLRIFRNFCQFDESNSLKAWIFRIATNESLRLLGKRKGKETLSLDDLTTDVIGRQADGYYDDSDQVAARLQKAIQQLPAKQQLAFNLRYYDEMAYEEIAQVAGSTAASMKMSYSIAKERIIRYINSNEEGI
jgi:RNA polymerase sigma-70 factor (ECF subfamily)